MPYRVKAGTTTKVRQIPPPGHPGGPWVAGVAIRQTVYEELAPGDYAGELVLRRKNSGFETRVAASDVEEL